MKKTEERLKNNNRGFTLMELIVTVAIIAIFSGVILTFIGTGANSYRSTSSSAKVQMEAQETADSLEDLIIDVNYSIYYYRNASGGAITNDIDGTSGTGDKVLIICNKNSSGSTAGNTDPGDSNTAGYTYDILYWNSTEQKIYYSQNTTDSVPPRTSGSVLVYYSQNTTDSVPPGTSGSVLAEGITDFQADVSKAASDKIVRFQLGVKSGTKEIKTLHSVTLRNTVKIQ